MSWKLASDKSLGSVAGLKRHGQNDGVFTVSKVASDTESTQEDAACFTLVEPAFSSQSDASSSISSDVDNLSQLVATLAEDEGEVPTDTDAECIGETNEAGLLPLQSIKGGEVSVTTMLPQQASSGLNTATSTSVTPGVVLSSVGIAAAESTKKCAKHIFSLSSAQVDFTFKFEKGSGFATSSEVQPGIEKKRGEVFVERAADDSESSDSFAPSENSESRPRCSESQIEGTGVDAKDGDGRTGGTAIIVRSSTSKMEPRCTYEGKSRGGIGCTGTGKKNSLSSVPRRTGVV